MAASSWDNLPRRAVFEPETIEMQRAAGGCEACHTKVLVRLDMRNIPFLVTSCERLGPWSQHRGLAWKQCLRGGQSRDTGSACPNE